LKPLGKLCPFCIKEIPAEAEACAYCGKQMPPRDRRADMRRYSDKYLELSSRMLRDCYFSAGGKNVMISPLSILLLLSMAADGTKGSTRQEILDALGDPEAGPALGWLREAIAEDPSFSSASAVCVRKDKAPSVRREYGERLRQVYGGEIFASEHMTEDVDAWVSKNTRGMIRDAAPDTLDQMVLCLLNAVAFEGSWEEPYPDYRIGTANFTNADGTVSRVKMLRGEENRYIENRDFTGFIKDYRDGDFSYAALLPRREGVEALESALMRLNLRSALMPEYGVEVQTGLPEHKFEFARDMTSLCMELGIERMFDDGADFSAMASFPLKVESVTHKTYLEVDRTGTRAAAFTGGWAAEAYEPEKRREKVYLNRPFVFAICWNALPVFLGVVNSLEDTDNGEKK